MSTFHSLSILLKKLWFGYFFQVQWLFLIDWKSHSKVSINFSTLYNSNHCKSCYAWLAICFVISNTSQASNFCIAAFSLFNCDETNYKNLGFFWASLVFLKSESAPLQMPIKAHADKPPSLENRRNRSSQQKEDMQFSHSIYQRKRKCQVYTAPVISNDQLKITFVDSCFIAWWSCLWMSVQKETGLFGKQTPTARPFSQHLPLMSFYASCLSDIFNFRLLHKRLLLKMQWFNGKNQWQGKFWTWNSIIYFVRNSALGTAYNPNWHIL